MDSESRFEQALGRSSNHRAVSGAAGTVRKEGAMGYDVQFIGLMCFQPNPGGRGRRVLLPDGRFPEDRRVSPHIASISVWKKDLRSFEGWPDHQVNSDPWETEFVFGPSTIALPFSRSEAATYTEAALFADIPNLSGMSRTFQIDYERANWVGSVVVEQGNIRAVRLPGVSRAPLIGELQVDYDEEIAITVTARKGWPDRRIVLAPGSEIALINTSRGLPPRSDNLDHFKIYEELSSLECELEGPSFDSSKYPESTSQHPAFRQARPATFIDTNCIITSSE